ncbi:endosome-associated ubiquitin isopeptidase [Elaphomyces granulatus]
MALTVHQVVTSPQSVEQITRMAQDYEYNQLIPLRYWLRTARSLIKEAEIYEREGHDEKAYLLLFRHAQLVLVHLLNGPKDEPNRKPLLQVEREVKVTLQKLEVLKPRINRRYERYMQLMYERGSWEPVSSSQRKDSLTAQGHRPADHALVGVAQPLEAGENRELAVKLARKEISRRASARQAIDAGISRGGAHSCRGHLEEEDKPAVADDLTRRIQQVRMNIDQAQTENRRLSLGEQSSERLAPREGLSQSSASYRYPTVPRQRHFEATIPSPVLPRKIIHELIKPPERPPKEPRLPSKLAMLDEPPPRPSKVSDVSPSPSEVSSSETSVIPSDLDPSTFTFKPSAYLENGTPLRTVFLPPNLRSHFLAIASPNTRRNLETCGILCGTLISNALFISKLLIPEQESTSDTCETVNESAIFDYCDSEDLMVLGWIHTHPSQTCFMSSRDLHTQCGYQAMLPESIAIVCAPSKDPDWGVFRLTDPPGLKLVSNCTQTGLFHPHTVSNLYTDALRPGHVFEAQGLEFETVDLRPGI